jgi:hypothetical protein
MMLKVVRGIRIRVLAALACFAVQAQSPDPTARASGDKE